MSEIDSCGKNDPLYSLAVNLVIESKRLSPSYVQRHFRISYSRAQRLIDAISQSLIEATNNANKTGEENV